MIDNGDGTFTTLGYEKKKLSKFEQYLFGWIPKTEVAPLYIALNPISIGAPGTIIKGPFNKVTIEDIIKIHKERIPGPETALRNFRIGYIYKTKGRLATPAELTARELMTKHLSSWWHTATEGHSKVEFILPDYRIVEPESGKVSPDLSATIKFKVPEDTTWVQIQLSPFNGDGPGVNLVIGDQEIIKTGELKIPAPKIGEGPYITLPDMGYTWKIRATSQVQLPNLDQNKGWGAWLEKQFRTPKIIPQINLGSLSGNEETDDTTPTLNWASDNPQLFLYEVQLSEDPTFEVDPQKAKAPLFWNMVHGGINSPPNTWTFPKNLLTPGKRYFWRVRPRIQGDGTPLKWSAIGSFSLTSSR